ncbi:hypothetical protein [Frigoribacterium sp. NPDC087798]|uniref:hypothetical protein n=1 Tax=Frigoribacterium sp. NPDC087798 TaxID=3363993 RepID=UPI003829A1AE
MAFLFVSILLILVGFRIGQPGRLQRPSTQRAIDVGLPFAKSGITISTIGNGFGLATATVRGDTFAVVGELLALAVNVYVLWQVARYSRRLRSDALDHVFTQAR